MKIKDFLTTTEADNSFTLWVHYYDEHEKTWKVEKIATQKTQLEKFPNCVKNAKIAEIDYLEEVDEWDININLHYKQFLKLDC